MSRLNARKGTAALGNRINVESEEKSVTMGSLAAGGLPAAPGRNGWSIHIVHKKELPVGALR
jgi:hypothetical protein